MRPNNTIDARHIEAIMSRSFSSISRRFPNRYPSISVVIPPPWIRNITSPSANIPVRKIAIDASPVRISLDCNSWIIMDAVTEKTSAYHKGDVEPRTIPTATPPNETWASPSPINARLRIRRKDPRKPATIVTNMAASNARWNISMVKK